MRNASVPCELERINVKLQKVDLDSILLEIRTNLKFRCQSPQSLSA